MTEPEFTDSCDECGTRLYQAGERAPEGEYLRVDDGSFHQITLARGVALPASFDGHIALYRLAAAPCACQRRHFARQPAAASVAIAPSTDAEG
ncbi:MAG TPA: hypothetical protein VFX31_15090 [Ktedonobacterales bacterium]|jgi:hypothetical protein|nr:hypothetical protein [Ktedonobacterales bacterium]HEX5572721.1 hypothetical protein [Ktedonobacterales bacterium]